MFEFITVSVFVLYMIAVSSRYTCFFHDWEEHGPTKHMGWGIGKNEGKIFGWSRYWLVCSRCGAKRMGRKENDIES